MSENNYKNVGQGALFDNKNKNTEKQPDMTGKLEIDGKTYFISAWKTEPKAGGDEYLSLKISEKEESRPFVDV